jgi:UDPglucose 6-dehydrogenase
MGIGAGCAADLAYWESAARTIAAVSTSNKIVVEKSTVPVRTAEAIQKVLERNCLHSGVEFQILSNPEFLAEGTAIADLEAPDRVLIGGREDTEAGRDAIAALKAVYENWVPPERVITANLWSAELTKLAANAFLAQRISSINSISALCESTGADVSQVAFAIGKDTRVGARFLQASVGFGGSCFQKDILNLVYICESQGLKQVADYWRSVVTINDYQKSRFVKRIISGMFNTIRGKNVAVLGFAFKKDTGDTRETPAIDVCRGLMQDGANCIVYDPQVDEALMKSDLLDEYTGQSQVTAESVEKQLKVVGSAFAACSGSHAVAVLTEWDEFKDLDWKAIFDSMVKPAFVFDGRNILDHAHLRELGFIVYALGKPIDPFLKNGDVL